RIKNFEYSFELSTTSNNYDLIRKDISSDTKAEKILKIDQLRGYFGTSTISSLRISPNQTHLAFTLALLNGETDVLIVWPIERPDQFIKGPSQVHDFEWGSN